MKKKNYLFCVLLFVAGHVVPIGATGQAQLTHFIDSLEAAITQATNDTAKANLYYELMPRLHRRYITGGLTSRDSQYFFRQQEAYQRLSERARYPSGIGISILWAATMYHYLKNAETGDEQLTQAFAVLREARDYRGLSYAYYRKGHIGSDEGARIRAFDTGAICAKMVNDFPNEVLNVRSKANLIMNQGKLLEAKQQLLLLLDRQLERNDWTACYTADLLCVISTRLSDLKAALRFAISSIDYCHKLGDTLLIGTFYQRLGKVYLQTQDYPKAMASFRRQLGTLTKSNDENMKSVAVQLIGNMATCLLHQGDKEEAVHFLNANMPPLSAAELVPILYRDVIYVDIYSTIGNYKEAEKALLSVFNSPLKAGGELKALVYSKAALIYMALGQPQKALNYADSAMQFNGSTDGRRWVRMAENYYVFYKADSIKGRQGAAFAHYKDYRDAVDSATKDVSSKQLMQLAVEYETDQKTAEVAFLSGQSVLLQKNVDQAKLLRNTMIAASLLLASLLAVSVNRYLIKKRTNLLLEKKQAEINEQNGKLSVMIEEEKKLTAERGKLLLEKEWLLKEVNHRVKNNLQTVIGLLGAQRSVLRDGNALLAIEESEHRIHAISLIHQKLYQRSLLHPTVAMDDYIGELIAYLEDSLGTLGKIRTELFIAPIELDVSQVVPIGLIINEAFTNAAKYAFPADRIGLVQISLQDMGSGLVRLRIADNGVGLAEDYASQKHESLGMRLMEGLSWQIDGRFEIEPGPGLCIIITFERSVQVHVSDRSELVPGHG